LGGSNAVRGFCGSIGEAGRGGTLGAGGWELGRGAVLGGWPAAGGFWAGGWDRGRDEKSGVERAGVLGGVGMGRFGGTEGGRSGFIPEGGCGAGRDVGGEIGRAGPCSSDACGRGGGAENVRGG
jgi:hypothetical protein